ncbi:MAG: integrase [Parcubacteria group bacterium CG10_big_fil_rev_8_21_14_0_10_41_35]|nr:MAG: integrase [Parcubacteria group bacterium CG10_big_fil_rev_8_21_14_0_10_41_35]
MMSKMSKREYLIQLKRKYWKAKRKVKIQLLNDFCDFTRYNRKYAIELLNNPIPAKWKRYKIREKIYGQDVIEPLLILWRATNEICGERFHPFIPTLLPKMITLSEIKVNPEVQEKLLTISLGTVKRIIRRTKRISRIKIGGTTKPGSILKKQIAIRYGRWTDTDPGWCETDTVAHCGDNTGGEFIYSLDVIDICSGWSEQAAIWGKGEMATKEQMDIIRNRLPFKLLGLDPDNGSEFINWQMFRYCQKNGITLTRSRPYHKNDNAHVEQKNYTAIRQLVGYHRLEKREQQAILNNLYSNEWRSYLNFFQPTMKLKEKVKDTGTKKTTKKYYEAKTPYQRLMEHEKISQEQKDMLKSVYERLNPIILQAEIKRKLELIRKTLR